MDADVGYQFAIESFGASGFIDPATV